MKDSHGPGLLKNGTYRFMVIIVLLGVACFLTYFFRNVLGIGTVFSHFFYIPIILACIWWRKRGLLVTVFLTGLLLFSPKLFSHYALSLDDYLRALMLLVISFVIVVLSEKLSMAKEDLQISEKRYRTVFETTGTAMVIIEKDETISLVNKEFEKMSGFSRTEVENNMSWTAFVAEEDLTGINEYRLQQMNDLGGTLQKYEFGFVDRRGERKAVLATIDQIPGTQKRVASFADVTELKHALEEQKMLQRRLAEALAKVLSGFIPICANCKKIREADNTWVQIESYISGHTDADFSHGICPDCIRVLYPNIADSL